MEGVFFILLCIAAVVSASSSRSISSFDLECIVDFLKNKGIISCELESPIPLSSQCFASIENAKSVKIEIFNKDWKINSTYSENQIECLKKSLIKKEYFDRKLVDFIDDSSSGMPRQRLQKLNHDIEKLNKKEENDEILLCRFEKEFNREFEKFFVDEEIPKTKSDEIEDFCARKYVITNDLLTHDFEKLELNPKNIDDSAIDCEAYDLKMIKLEEEKLVKLANENFRSQNRRRLLHKAELKQEKCLVEYFAREEIFSKFLQFRFLKEFNLSASEKNQWRDRFVQFMLSISSQLLECFSTHARVSVRSKKNSGEV